MRSTRRVRRRGPRSHVARERRRARREHLDDRTGRSDRPSTDSDLGDHPDEFPQGKVCHDPPPQVVPGFSPVREVEDYHEVVPPANACGQSQAADFTTESFTFLFLNIQGYVSHDAELSALIESCDFPTFVGLNETFFPGEGILKEVDLKGYTKVSRLDRRDGSGWGGIMLFAKEGYQDFIVHVGDSEVAERSWHILHTDRGLVSLCLWYRPPNRGEIDSISTLPHELDQFAKDVCGHIIVGDLNVHQESWLKHSSDGNTTEGKELHAFCRERGLDERVRKPTRGNNLLDLVLTDLASLVKCRVISGISDHEAVLSTFEFPLPEVAAHEREVFLFNKARWGEMREELCKTDWSTIILEGDADGSSERFTEFLLDVCGRYIPRKRIHDRAESHPWLDDNCRRLIWRKRSARGTVDFVLRRDECSRGLVKAYNAFAARTRDKLQQMGSSSRGWWKVAKSLMSASSVRSTVPPLLRCDGSWATTSKEKADLFSEVFASKSSLDDAEENEFSEILEMDNVKMGNGFLAIRRRYVRSVLKGLNENSGTGPDLLASRVLRRCRSALELPILLLARVIVASGRWPQTWRLHWVVPLYKKKSKADAANYRGIHLTPQLSKVIERVVGKAFLPWIYRHDKFGTNQYAYGQGKSHRDALAVNVFSWLLKLEEGDIVALYCSDVSGAFDRVRRERLLAKLSASGIHPTILRFLASWLEDRKSVVVVNGDSSAERILANSVFQGTVLGPPLWNLFYLDACLAVRRLEFTDVVFADDFNAWKTFTQGTAIDDMLAECLQCQDSLHSWGRANSVKFDPSKESFHVLHRTRAHGDDFCFWEFCSTASFECTVPCHVCPGRRDGGSKQFCDRGDFFTRGIWSIFTNRLCCRT